MAAYSMDFREAVARAYDRGDTSAEVADSFGCSASWVRRLVQRRRGTGSLAPLPAGNPGDRRAYDDADERTIRDLIADRPDATLAEVVAAVGKPAHPSTACRALARLGLPRKKSRRTRPSGTAPTSGPRGTLGPAGSPT